MNNLFMKVKWKPSRAIYSQWQIRLRICHWEYIGVLHNARNYLLSYCCLSAGSLANIVMTRSKGNDEISMECNHTQLPWIHFMMQYTDIITNAFLFHLLKEWRINAETTYFLNYQLVVELRLLSVWLRLVKIYYLGKLAVCRLLTMSCSILQRYNVLQIYPSIVLIDGGYLVSYKDAQQKIAHYRTFIILLST